MKIAVLGAGMMGRAAVFDLARAEGVTDVLIMDREAVRAAEVAARYGNGRAWPFSFDVEDPVELERFLSQFPICEVPGAKRPPRGLRAASVCRPPPRARRRGS